MTKGAWLGLALIGWPLMSCAMVEFIESPLLLACWLIISHAVGAAWWQRWRDEV